MAGDISKGEQLRAALGKHRGSKRYGKYSIPTTFASELCLPRGCFPTHACSHPFLVRLRVQNGRHFSVGYLVRQSIVGLARRTRPSCGWSGAPREQAKPPTESLRRRLVAPEGELINAGFGEKQVSARNPTGVNFSDFGHFVGIQALNRHCCVVQSQRRAQASQRDGLDDRVCETLRSWLEDAEADAESDGGNKERDHSIDAPILWRWGLGDPLSLRA